LDFRGRRAFKLDIDERLMYFGTSDPSPWSKRARPRLGDIAVYGIIKLNIH